MLLDGGHWHRHAGCRYATTPATRTDFWQAKLDGNVRRDKGGQVELVQLGWRVATIWECALRKSEQTDLIADRVAAWLRQGSRTIEIGEREITMPTHPGTS